MILARKRVHAMGLFLLMVLSVCECAVGAISIDSEKLKEQNLFQFSDHPPIHINGNGDFATQAANEGWQGNGTRENPYIIEGYEIDAHGGAYCIWIENTDVYFVVRNCLLRNATDPTTVPYGSGIYLNFVTNGKIEKIICKNTNYGIYISSSYSNIIKRNEICLNFYGIYAIASSSNQIVKNTIENNTEWGIYLMLADINELIWNSVKNNSGGIYLLNAYSNLIRNHNISENRGNGIVLESSYGTKVYYNTFYKNLDYAVVVKGSYNWNSIYCNNFISNNGAQKGLIGNCQVYDEDGTTEWYDSNGMEGNYWSNWDGSDWGTPNAYPIDGGKASDWYPLAEPIEPTTPPIRIAGNAELVDAAVEYGWHGNGTVENPYIIEGYTIDFRGGNYGIWIENTDMHFVIRNCSLKGGDYGWNVPYGSGIALANVRNARIENNKCNTSNIGLYIYDFSENIYIANNTILEPWHYGISVDTLKNATIKGNTILMARDAGIRLTASEGIKFSGNNLRLCGFEIQGYDIRHWVNNEIDITNLVNGKPVYFYKNESNLSFSGDCGQLLIANSTNISVANLSLDSCTVGVGMAFSSFNRVENATISGCRYGILLQYSHSNTIERCTITDNRETGLVLQNGYNNTLSGNIVTNGFMGMSIIFSYGNIITKNTVERNLMSGIGLIIAENNKISYNEVHNNWQAGIDIGYMSNGNLVVGNNVSNSVGGIILEFGCNNIIKGNNLTNCGIRLIGDYIENWNTHEIDTSNLVNGKPVYYYKNMTSGVAPKNAGQVIFANCTGMLVENLTATNCSVGITLGFSSGNLIRNVVVENSTYGVFLSHSNKNTVENSRFANNNGGIYLWASENNTLTRCKFETGYFGILIESSFSNLITWNEIKGTGEGIAVWHSSFNEITNNIIKENLKGITLYISSNNTIFYNTFEANLGYGVAIYWSSYGNLIYRNNFVGNNRDGKGVTGNCQAYDGGDGNYWYDNIAQEGNYWSNWDGQGWGTPNAYPIDGGKASDWYPLTIPVVEGTGVSLPLFVSLLLLASFGVMARRKHQ